MRFYRSGASEDARRDTQSLQRKNATTVITTTLARDESGDRAKLKILYQMYRYPEEFTDDSLGYIERTSLG